MTSDGGNNEAPPKTPILSGGASSALDMTNERDRGLVRQAMKNWPKRWRGLTPELKDALAADLQWAVKEAKDNPATEYDPLNGAKVVLSAIKTAAMMEAQNQADEHLADKNSRLDEGKSTENVSLVKCIKGVDEGAL